MGNKFIAKINGMNHALKPPLLQSQGNITADAKSQVEAMLKQAFRPEFLNRLDEIVFYKPLSVKDVVQIVKLMLRSLSVRLAEKQLTLKVSEKAESVIAESGYDPMFGARPLRRYIQARIETLIARAILSEDPAPGSTLSVDVNENGFFVEVLAPKD